MEPMPPSPAAGGRASAVSEPARDHIAVDVSEGRELQSVPAGEAGQSSDFGSVGGDGEVPTSAGQEARRGENFAEREIRSLLWLERPESQLGAKAHKAWEEEDLLFASRIDKKEKQSNSFRNEVSQLIGFYSVFQGVLLTAVAQSNLLYCHIWWTAFFLSLLASAVAIGGIIGKFQAVLALELSIKNEESTRKECVIRGTRLIQKRQDFDFEKEVPDGRNQVFDLTWLKFSALIVFVSLLCFSGLFLVSIRQILCDPGGPSSAPAMGSS